MAAGMALVVLVAAFPAPVLAAAAKAKSATAVAGGSMISATDEWGLWATLMVCAAAGLHAEKTKIGAALSSPLVTMFIALILVNVGILPADAPLYAAVNKFLVPLAVPMLLLGADIRRVLRDTGSLLLAFLIGTVATIVSVVAAAAVKLHCLATDNPRTQLPALGTNLHACSDSRAPTHVPHAGAAHARGGWRLENCSGSVLTSHWRCYQLRSRL